MQYFVIWPDGQKFGPADVNQLAAWAQENRINPETELESVVDGSRLKAKDLPSLTFPNANPVDPVTPAVPVNNDPVSQPAEPTPSATFSTEPAATPQSSTPAQYFVIGTGGQKYGPADVATLTQWASENRLTPTTELEDSVTGVRQIASQTPGIVFPVAAAGSGYSAPASTEQTYSGGPSTGGTASPYGSAAQSNYPRDFSDPDAGKTEAIISFVCSGIGFFCCCFLSIAGIILGSISKNKGHKWGNTAFILGWVALLGGIVLSVIMNLAMGGFEQIMRAGQ